ncbi:hypothetical protein H3U87_00025 [Bifidobacterium sp. W8101]|uniref:hypothetical protein n=1 Tax=Bifidobacterium TaxID=1678 RepID=UPI0018DB9F3F|nr:MULTISPECIES: hypothetical protein [Bifidobacterium]MBI0125538.1 hypothetical protein [Bifidobacterium choladohabitans]MBI0127106.1 hypothetical protein [Bifidobacterium sp. W8103]MBI0137697.1 hypothetical protein [Bifidobacterium sp. W8105]MBI0149332.1 hypothetical protein [Bifidobacterium sp. W8107]
MKQFFHDISWAQIIAGALAAMTSFWLAAKIGVAGSIIGVAIGSIVSAVASQIYKNVLEASGQKLQESVVGGADQDDDDSRADSDADSGADGQTTTLPAQGKGHSDKSSDAADGSTQVMAPVDGSTQVMPPVNDEKSAAKTGRTVSSSNGPRTHAASMTATSRKKLDQRRRNVIIVSVVSALVAVLLSALAINALTKGEGTDKVVRNVVSPPTSQTVTPSEEETPSKPARRTEEPEYQTTPSAPQNQPSGSNQNQGSEQGSGQSQPQGGNPTSSPSPSADATSSTPSPSSTAPTPQSSPTSTTSPSPRN